MVKDRVFRMVLNLAARLQGLAASRKSSFLRRVISFLERLIIRREAAAMLSRMTVRDVMRPVVETASAASSADLSGSKALAPIRAAHPEMTIADAKMLAQETGLSGVPVVESMALAGWLDYEPRRNLPGRFPINYLIDRDPLQIHPDRPADTVKDYLHEDLPVCVVDSVDILWGVVTWESYRAARRRALLSFLRSADAQHPEPGG